MPRITRVAIPEVPHHITCHERTGRPLGTDSFIGRLENAPGRILHKQKPGPKGPQKKNRGQGGTLPLFSHQIKQEIWEVSL